MNAAVVDLFDGVDDLIRRVADTESPEIRKVRARVHAALTVAKSAVEDDANRIPAPVAVVTEAAPVQSAPVATVPEKSTGDGVGELPVQTIGIVLLLGVGLGLVLGQRSDTR